MASILSSSALLQTLQWSYTSTDCHDLLVTHKTKIFDVDLGKELHPDFSDSAPTVCHQMAIMMELVGASRDIYYFSTF